MSPADIGEGHGRGDWLDSEDVRLDSPEPAVIVSSRSCYSSNGTNGKGTSVLGAVFLIVNAALGAGLLNFPQAYGQAGGVAVAMSIQLGLLFFIGASLLILAWCSDRGGFVTTYQDVVRVCGPNWQRAASVCVILYCYGTCITFLIIIGDQSDRIFVSLWGSDFCTFWYMNRRFTIVATSLVFIGPLCFPRRIDFLKYASFLGVFSIMYLNGIIAYKYSTGEMTPGEINTRPKVWTDVFLVVPVICFGYQCHVSCVPIYSCMENRSLGTFIRSVLLALLICAATYSTAGILGYLTLGSNVPSDILEAYDAKDPLVLVGLISLALKMYTTYPILLFCGREAVNQLYLECRTFQHPTTSARGEKRRRIAIASLWFLSTLVVSVVVPSITTVIDLLGSLAAVFVFFFPGVCLIKLALRDSDDQRERLHLKTKAQLALGIASVALGVLLFTLVLLQTIIEDIRSGSDSKSQSLCIP